MCTTLLADGRHASIRMIKGFRNSSAIGPVSRLRCCGRALPIGAILIRRMEVRPFSDEQIELLETFADQAVIAIENARLFQERETRNRDLSALHEVTAAASQSLEIKPVLDEVLEKITEIFKFDRVSIFLFDPKRETLTRMATFGIAQEETATGLSAVARDLQAKWPRPVNTWSLRMSDRTHDIGS